MKTYAETRLRDFEFWSGAKSRAKRLTADQLDQLEFCLEELYQDGMSEGQINDIMWFEEDFVAECLGFADWEELEEAEEED